MLNFNHYRNTENYFWLLIMVVGLLIFPSFSFLMGDSAGWVFNIFYSLVILTALYTVTSSIRHLGVGGILGVLTLVSLWAEFSITGMEVVGLGSLVLAFIFFIFIGIHLARSLIRSSEINLNVIYGAIVGYMLLGILFGQLFIILHLWFPDAFRGISESTTRYQYIYFSFATLTTLGYGDIVPNNDPARAFTVLEAIIGQVYLTIILAILVGKYLNRQSPGETL